MKHKALFSSKDKSKKLKCGLLQFLFGTLRVNMSQQRSLFVLTNFVHHYYLDESICSFGDF